MLREARSEPGNETEPYFARDARRCATRELHLAASEKEREKTNALGEHGGTRVSDVVVPDMECFSCFAMFILQKSARTATGFTAA